MNSKHLPIALGLLLILSACSWEPKSTEGLPQQAPGGKADAGQEAPGIELDEASWLEFSKPEMAFSLRHPQDWTRSEGEAFGAYHAFFSNSDSGARMGVLPKGELDFGLPSDPTLTETMVGGKKAEQRLWKLDDGKVLVFVQLSEYPDAWNQDNRIQFSGQESEMETFQKMLSSFRFLE